MQLLLQVVGQESPGPLLRLAAGQYVLGRSSECQVRLTDNTVSRRHAILNVGLDGASVRDLGSRHGTWLNSVRTVGEQSLHDGDRLSIAQRLFRLQLLTDEDYPGRGCLTVPSAGQGQAVEIQALVGGLPIRDGLWLPEFAVPVEETWTRIYIYNLLSFPAPSEMERALDSLLQGHGRVTAGDEDRGPGWSIHLMLYAGADVAAWIGRLVAFLQNWPVQEGTGLSVTTYPAAGGFKHYRIEIPVP